MKSYKHLLFTFFIVIAYFFILSPLSPSHAARGRILLSEPDGSPSKKPVYEIQVPNGTLSETGGVGSVSVEPAQTAASQVEAEAGTESGVRSWSPLRIFQGIASWWSNTGRKAPGAIGDTTPSRGTFSPTISKGPAIINSGFTGTVSSSGATVTFSSAEDSARAGYSATNTSSGLGSTLIAAAQTRYITAWTNSTTCTVSSAPSPAWGAGTAITSVQLPIATFIGSDGVVAGWVLADKSVYLLGNLGIGTMSSGVKLQTADGSPTLPTLDSMFSRGLVISSQANDIGLGIITNKAGGDSAIGFGDSGDGIAGWIQYDHTDNAMRFGTNSATFQSGAKMVIDNGGNVGIGTTSPSAKLDVFGGIAAGLNDVLWLSGGAQTYNSGPRMVFHNRFGDNSLPTWRLGEIGSIYLQTAKAYSGGLVFNVNDGDTVTDIVEAMRITNTGNVGIGTTTPNGQFSQGGSYGSQYVRKSYSASANIAAAATATVQVNVPTGVRILSTACQVSSALAAGDLWDLEANDGGTVSALATGLAVALNTADYDLLSGVITDAETDLVVTKNGGGNFTAQGTIRCTVWGEYQTVLTAN